MNLSFQSIVDEQTWKQALADFPEANFLQSWEWGVFQEKLNKKIWRYGCYEQKQQTTVGIFQIVKETAKRGNYLTIAGGPLLDWDKNQQQQLADIFAFIKKLAKEEDCSFVRFRPQAIETPQLKSRLSHLNIRPAPMHLTADLTLQLDLTKDLDTLLKEMRKNTRYEIKQSEKKGIVVKQTKDTQAITEFYEQQVELAKKHHFVPFGYDFLIKQFQVFADKNQAILFSSYLNEKLLASAFIIFNHQEAVYHYGISTPENDHLPGSYACQWAAIQEAKLRDCKRYNFWGIAPKDETNHRFAGVSLFKRGFGGEEIAYLPAQDLPVSWTYWFTYVFEVLRKKFRKL